MEHPRTHCAHRVSSHSSSQATGKLWMRVATAQSYNWPQTWLMPMRCALFAFIVSKHKLNSENCCTRIHGSHSAFTVPFKFRQTERCGKMMCFKHIPHALSTLSRFFFHFEYLFFCLFLLVEPAHMITGWLHVFTISSCSVSPHSWRSLRSPFISIHFRCDDDACRLPIEMRLCMCVCGAMRSSSVWLHHAVVFVCIILISSVSVSLTTSDPLGCALRSSRHWLHKFTYNIRISHDYLMPVIVLPPFYSFATRYGGCSSIPVALKCRLLRCKLQTEKTTASNRLSQCT